MRTIRQFLAALIAPVDCSYSGLASHDCAGCQADRNLAPTWPADHTPFATASMPLVTRELSDPEITSDWRQAA